jgi:nitric oxide reductase subunit B
MSSEVQNGNGNGIPKNTFAQWLLAKKNWWLQFAVVAGISIVGLLALGTWTYQGAPPLAGFVSSSGETVVSLDQINRGKEVFHLRGLMAWGTFWGDGAERGPDFTADALHRTVLGMTAFYQNQGVDDDAIATRIQRELHTNGWNEQANEIVINDAQVFAVDELEKHFTRMFTDPTYEEAFAPSGLISDPGDIRALTAYFYWGSWVSAANRPGETYSYTHNWPYDPAAANTPTANTMVWSYLSIMALFAGAMLVLYVYGQMRELPGDPFNGADGGTLTTSELEKGYEYVRPTQRLTYKFFAFAIILFVVQVLAGILSAEDFVGGGPGVAITTFLGVSLPYSVVRSYHALLQIYWFFMCWVGYTIFFLPRLSKVPNGQRFLINLLFFLVVLVGAGALVGIYLGQTGALSDGVSYWFGSQGWEFMELGRFWQILMLCGFVLWVGIIFRGVRPWITKANMWSVPAWLFYGSGIMVAFLFFGLLVTPRVNFAISDYWRWMVVHMWVEVTFEVFTTCVVGYMLVQMGLLKRAMAERVIFLAVMMFLVTATVGISHNFYWIAKPSGIIALGSVFSTLQVLPLLLITLDAWRMREEKVRANQHAFEGKQHFVMNGVWLFILAINFWNIVGAGVFGSMINLPIVNYFEHATFLTANHAHAAMFGVKGNVALGGMLFCCQHLFKRSDWSERLVRNVFWALQIGIVLMMTLDLFPAGMYQLWDIVQNGYWHGRTQAFVTGPVFTVLTWLRVVGGVVFLFGGVLPLAWFILSRAGRLVREVEIEEGEWTVYDKEWAAGEEEIARVIK